MGFSREEAAGIVRERMALMRAERQGEERLRRSALDGTWAEARPDDLSFRAAARRRQVQYMAFGIGGPTGIGIPG